MSIKFDNEKNQSKKSNIRFDVLYKRYLNPQFNGVLDITCFKNLFDIIHADPTSVIPKDMTASTAKPDDMSKVKIGKYSKWLLKQLMNPIGDVFSDLDPQSPEHKKLFKKHETQFFEDLYKVTGDLKKYERFKHKLSEEFRDINKLTIESLYEQVKDFSLEKTKATAEEKKEASKTYEHPGADIVYRGEEWTVARISDKGELGKDAACFYGGYYLEPQKGETRWCTASPGLNWFDRYIKDGPLYVVIPNTPRKFTSSHEIGQKSGLPSYRYQFHFPSNQYMDPADRQIDLVDFLQNGESGLKHYFKHEFMKCLSQNDGEKVSVNYPSDSASKFIALYGFDEFFDTLPTNIKRFEFIHKGDKKFNLELPEKIGEFKQLTALHLVGCVSKIPESVGNLKDLKFLSLPDNNNLELLPECLASLPNLCIINIKNSNVKNVVPDKLRQRAAKDKEFFIFDTM